MNNAIYIAKIRVSPFGSFLLFSLPRFLCVLLSFRFSSIVVAVGIHVRSFLSPNNYWSVSFITTDNTPHKMEKERIRVAHVFLSVLRKQMENNKY